MAAKLDIVPDPFVMLVQGVIFMIGYAIINKLMVQPYLKLRQKRESLTVGRQGDATQALAEVERLSAEITSRITKVVEEEKMKREEIRGRALQERQKLLTEAEATARSEINSVTNKIQQRLSEEKAKIPNVVAQLTDDVFALALKS